MTKSEPSNDVRHRRETKRKRLLREALESTDQGQAVLLDEVRWKVMGAQIAECVDENARRSLFNSFARTVREQLTGYALQKIPVAPKTPIGVVARAAVYRLRDADALRRFLQSAESCILCRYTTNLEVEKPRYRAGSRYVIPHHHAATFRFFERRPATITYDELEGVPGTYIPATQKLTLIVPRGGVGDLASYATLPWNLYRYDDLTHWLEVKGTDPLEEVQRNRYQ